MKKFIMFIALISLSVSLFAVTSNHTNIDETYFHYRERCGGVSYTVFYDNYGWDVYVEFYNNNSFDVDVEYQLYGKAGVVNQPKCLVNSSNSISAKSTLRVNLPRYSALKNTTSVTFQVYRYY